MHDLGGPLIVLVLGIFAGIYFHDRWRRRFWTATLIATLAATLAWGGGCYLLFFLVGDDEPGPPLLVPVLLTMLTADVGAVFAGGAIRLLCANT